jgi:hypothetical protein
MILLPEYMKGFDTPTLNICFLAAQLFIPRPWTEYVTVVKAPMYSLKDGELKVIGDVDRSNFLELCEMIRRGNGIRANGKIVFLLDAKTCKGVVIDCVD